VIILHAKTSILAKAKLGLIAEASNLDAKATAGVYDESLWAHEPPAAPLGFSHSLFSQTRAQLWGRSRSQTCVHRRVYHPESQSFLACPWEQHLMVPIFDRAPNDISPAVPRCK
jgi:hypothetical protein